MGDKKMTELRIIEIAIKPPFKYFVQKVGCFGGGSIPEELCFNSLTKAKESCENLWLKNKILTSIYRVYYIFTSWIFLRVHAKSIHCRGHRERYRMA